MHKCLPLTLVALAIITGCRNEPDQYITNVYEGDTYIVESEAVEGERPLFTSNWDTAIHLSQGLYDVSPGEEAYAGMTIIQAVRGNVSTLDSLTYQLFWSRDGEEFFPYGHLTERNIESCELDWYFAPGLAPEMIPGTIHNGLIQFDVDLDMDSEAGQDNMELSTRIYPNIYCTVKEEGIDEHNTYFKLELFHIEAHNDVGTSDWYPLTENGNPPDRYHRIVSQTP